VVDSKNTRKS